MDVIFEPQKGRPFSIEVGFFDTVLEIKQKIEKYQSIPISNQTLVFNRQVLHDDRDVAHCEILQDSRIQLVIASSNSESPTLKMDSFSSSSSPGQKKKISLNVKISTSKIQFPVEMDVNDTVLALKDKISQEMEPAAASASRMVFHSSGGGRELQDNRSLGECELFDNAEIEVSLRPSPTAATVGSKKLKLTVKTKCGTRKIQVEVNASDNVGELRKELQKLHQRLHFHLPPDGYFFIYKQNVMDDDKSFRWHHVTQGDTIEIFNGSVTGGS
ncbi:Ubiquitin domain containing protein [Parasponia andersonii]|uniref:Ubiquitin domain containing protein n=1 Tax=Parasponia andersonii TaxID=3476 RepID=A0A2P5ASD0_PARAD|nr:Ubiquitin domain containing protein [Parasponia andersonii]